MTEPAHVLLSAFPAGTELCRRLEAVCSIEISAALSLSELRGLSLLGILRALRRTRAKTIWIPAGEPISQPLLPLLLMCASLTRAGQLRVVDGAGSSRPVRRLGVLGREPARLLIGSARGFWHLAQTARLSKALMAATETAPSRLERCSRVAYLGTNPWPGLQAGGSVGHMAGVVNEFHRRGHEITVYAVQALPMVDREVPTERISAGGPTGFPLELNSYTFQRCSTDKVARAMVGRRPDLIYQRNALSNCSGVILARKFGVPFILEYNGSEVWVAEHWGRPLAFPRTARRVEAVNLRHASLVVVVSNVLRQELVDRGVPPKRIVCYPNGIDPRIFDPERFTPAERAAQRARWGFGEAAVICLFLGTFGAWHGTEVFAQAVRRQALERREWLEAQRTRFVFVGDGQLMPRVREILAGVPEHLYRLTGLVKQEDAPLCLAAADILISPHVPNPDGSRFFGSPTKLFEYMAMGKAIVASELEQIGEVLAGSPHVGRDRLPGDGGLPPSSLALLTAPGSVQELTCALDYLVPRPELRARLGAAARARTLERFTWGHHVGAILERLQALYGTDVAVHGRQ